jgi:hypothetical protein
MSEGDTEQKSKRELVDEIAAKLDLAEGEDYPDNSANTMAAGFYKSGLESVHSEIVGDRDV